LEAVDWDRAEQAMAPDMAMVTATGMTKIKLPCHCR